MTFEQLFVFAVLIATLALFIWNRWRYDVVALMALTVVSIAGLVPPREVFAGFGHPAVITVAAVLVISQTLVNAGVVRIIAQLVWRVGDRPTVQVAALTGAVALLSAFMNNIAAMALLMPVGITIARRRGSPPSLLLMPMATASLIGGMTTLIGTPPNLIIASYRADVGPAPFGMFDFSPVGAGVAIAGLVFLSLIGWRLMPKRTESTAPEKLFDISEYIAEVRVSEDSRFAGRSLQEFMDALQEEAADVVILALFREGKRTSMPPMHTVLQTGDMLLVEAGSDDLRTLIRTAEMKLVNGSGDPHETAMEEAESLNLREIVIRPESPLIGQTVEDMQLRRRYGIHVLAVARRGGQLREQIKKIRFEVGDILLVQGRVGRACRELHCLPLADRGIKLGKPRRMPLTIGVFGAAIAASALDLVPASVAFVAAALVMVLSRLTSADEAYEAIDWPIIILLGAMIPVGRTLETTGAAQLIADWLAQAGHEFSVITMLGIILVVTMILSDIVNNAAAAILLAPIAIDLAAKIGASPDAFLMAVAIGASCAFNTPIGHQSNTLVLGPGGYHFGDYWKLGLPMSIVVVLVSIPLLMWAWPPFPG